MDKNGDNRDNLIKMLIMENYIMDTLETLGKPNPTVFVIDNPLLTNSRLILGEYPQAKIHAVCRYNHDVEDYIEERRVDIEGKSYPITFYHMFSVDVFRMLENGENVIFDVIYLDGEQHAHDTVKNLFHIKTLIRPHTMIFMVYSHRTRLRRRDRLPNGKKIQKPSIQLKPVLRSMKFHIHGKYPDIYKNFHKHSRYGKGRSMNMITLSSRRIVV